MMRFVDRKSELAVIERAFKDPGFQFIPVYGRRRVGKTRLVQEFIRGSVRAVLPKECWNWRRKRVCFWSKGTNSFPELCSHTLSPAAGKLFRSLLPPSGRRLTVCSIDFTPGL